MKSLSKNLNSRKQPTIAIPPPPQIYDAIKRYACDRYQIDESKIIRPFYPGDDYENEEYPEDCFVLDNPPFSILSRICDFYVQKGIRFFFCADADRVWQ